MKRIQLIEVCQFCELDEDLLMHFISENWIIPKAVDELCFDEEDLARIILIKELKFDLGVNDEAVPVILHLIDQLNLRMPNEIK